MDSLKCVCDGNGYDSLHAMVAGAVASSMIELTSRGRALTVLRNGGWEQWLRNLLLVHLEEHKHNVWGFAEASFDNTKRIDLVFYCKACTKVRFAVEVKTNFVLQGPAEINLRISDAIYQLAKLSSRHIPSYIVYGLTHLRGTDGGSLVVAQTRGVGKTDYKRFDTGNRIWPTSGTLQLPEICVSRHSLCDEAGCVWCCDKTETESRCVGEVRAWTAFVQSFDNDSDAHSLRFMSSDVDGYKLGPESIWRRRKGEPEPTPKKRRTNPWEKGNS